MPTDTQSNLGAGPTAFAESAGSGSVVFPFVPPTQWHYLSLGAGVQSSTMALMAARGEIGPMPQAAIFADTQDEPASVYRWLDWLEKQLPFQVIRVTRGKLSEEQLRLRAFKKDPTRFWAKSLIPAHVANKNGTKGIMGRQCTYNYKIEEIERIVRRLAKIKRGQKDVTVTQWIGISSDEVYRMKPARVKWAQHRWPLVELEMRRHHCLDWMKARGYPMPPRSACRYCPYHSNAEWRRLRDEEPEDFALAVQFERALQAVKAQTDNMGGVPYLHASLKPLDTVDLSTDEENGQTTHWGNECAGMCGV